MPLKWTRTKSRPVRNGREIETSTRSTRAQVRKTMPGMQNARVMVTCRGLYLTYSYVDTVVDTVEDDEDD